MRNTRDQKKIATSRRNSINGQQVLILEDSNSREFFRFSEGQLAEYDTTKANGLSVRLNEEELEAIRSFHKR